MTDQPTLDPRDADPRRAPGTDDIVPSADYCDGWDDGHAFAVKTRPPFVQTTAFGIGVVVGMLAAVVLMVAAIPR